VSSVSLPPIAEYIVVALPDSLAVAHEDCVKKTRRWNFIHEKTGQPRKIGKVSASTYQRLLYDDGMTNSEEWHVKGRYNPPYGYLKRSYEVAIILSLMICGAIAGYLFLDESLRVVVGLAIGYSFARSLFWLLYYFVEGKKRPWQFDLRTAFFVMTLAAVLLGIIALLLNEKP
jgi:hypothetical protein